MPWSRAELTWVTVAGAIVSVLFWPVWMLVPQSGLDSSWATGLAWAAELGLHWGRDVAFTYGPLGYTLDPMLRPIAQVVVAALLNVTAVVVLVAMIYQLVREGWSRPWSHGVLVAAIIAATCLTMAGSWSILVLVAIAAGVVALRTGSSRIILLSGVIVGIVGHQKLSEAAIAFGFSAVCAIGARRWRGLTEFLLTTSVIWCAAWVITGQSIGDLPSYLAATLQVVSGYAAAMSIERAGYEWHYLAALLVVGLLFKQVVGGSAAWHRLQRVMFVFAIGWTLWLTFKAGFTRHDGHDTYFFGLAFVMAAITLATFKNRPWIVYGVAVCAVSSAVLTASGLSFVAPIDRTDSLRSVGRTLSAISSEPYRKVAWSAAVRDIAQKSGLTPAIIGAIGTEATIVDPWDISTLRATDAIWDPVPALQLYNAYTPLLDDLNAVSLAERPRQVLRAVPYSAIDGRQPVWESPRYQLRLYCDYSVIAFPRWQLLRPAASTRCLDRTAAGSVEATAGEVVDVPRRPGSITLATVTPHRTLIGSLLQLLFKPSEVYVSYGGPDTHWRLPQSPAASDIMLSTPVLHPAFAALPVTPYRTLTVSTDSKIEFTFLDVLRDAVPTTVTSMTEPGVDGLRITDADGVPATAVPPALSAPWDVEVTAEHACDRLSPVGPNPHVALSLRAGSSLYVVPEVAGQVQVFVQTNGQFSEEQKVRFSAVDAPLVIQVPADHSGATWRIRVDPPRDGASLLCLDAPAQDGQPVISSPSVLPNAANGVANLVMANAAVIPVTATAPVLKRAVDVAVEPDGPCLRVTPTGPDPRVWLTLRPGATIYLAPQAGGEAQVFVQVDGTESESQSRRFPTSADVWYSIQVPADPSGASWTIRVDPPSGHASRICVDLSATVSH